MKIKRYKLPIQGKVLSDHPLTGADDDPICPIDISELVPTRQVFNSELGEAVEVPKYSFAMVNLNYNLDEEWCEVELEASEEFHNWTAGILPQLRGIQKEKGWKLDKSKMVEKLEKK